MDTHKQHGKSSGSFGLGPSLIVSLGSEVDGFGSFDFLTFFDLGAAPESSDLRLRETS